MITTRAQQKGDSLQYLAPKTDSRDHKPDRDGRGKPDASLLAELYLLPFSPSQQDAYVAKFAGSELGDPLWRGRPEQYRSALHQQPELRTLCSEPLTLFMVLRILPSLQVRARTQSASLFSRTQRARTHAGGRPPAGSGHAPSLPRGRNLFAL